MSRSLLVCAVCLSSAWLAVCTGIFPFDGWKKGRATYYGNEPWLWSIHEGSCGYGYIFKDEPLGWDVAAMSDANPSFAGSCGRCYEVKCDPMVLKDAYGNQLNRDSVCYDADAAVVVRTTDMCPCNLAENYYSNKRWCCGDMDHFDLSIWAFEKLADTKWGVLGINYRPVPCDYQPDKIAPTPSNPFPGQDPPPGDKETNRWVVAAAQQATTAADQLSNVVDEVYQDGASSPWQQASWLANVDESQMGPTGGKAVCGKVSPSGALAFQAPKGQFDNKISLQMWVKTDGGIPQVNVNLSGSGNECRPVKLQDMHQSGEQNGWSRYDLYLGLFAPAATDSVVSFAAAFTGCGSTSAGNLERIEIKNDKPYEQSLCVDQVKLVGA